MLFFACENQASIPTVTSGLEEAAFSIPIYPGTKILEPSGSAITISPPYTTITFILQTDKDKPLDTTKVIYFYKDALLKKGWKETEPKNSDSKESYLALQCRFYNSSIGQNLTGQFQLYVASKDGPITLYLRQWRDSYAGQKATDLFTHLKKELHEVESEIHLKYNSTGKLARWEYFLEDENFFVRRS